MNLAEQLSVLQAAQGDPAKLALATVDLAFASFSDADRTVLKETLQAAAIPHWCDAEILATLLQISLEESNSRLANLRKLTVVEPFPARGEYALNVHEATRLALRSWLSKERGEQFREISRQMVSYFNSDLSPAGRIEWIYHRLCSSSDEAATELEQLDREWTGSAHPEDRQALAVAMRELVETRMVAGRANLWASLCIAWTREERGETTQLGDEALRLIECARECGDLGAEGDAQCLLGRVMEERGNISDAQAAYGKYLITYRRLVKQDPSNAWWQLGLAMAHSFLGGVLEAQGKLSEAQAAYGEYLTISRRLVEQDPNNAGWQRDLAVAHGMVGGVLKAQGKLSKAQAAFGECLTISRRLAEQDPSNAGWQREIAVAHIWIGSVLEAQGKLSEAQAAFGECLTISRHLAEQDPENAGWQRDLALALYWVGEVFEAQGKLSEALEACEEYLAISSRLAVLDPDNADWLRGVAFARNRVADLLKMQGKGSGP